MRLNGKKWQVTRQDFERGYMVYNPQTKRSKGVWLPGGKNGAKFTVADSKLPRPAWYERAWDSVVEETTLGDIAFLGTMAGWGISTALACVPPWALATCAPVVGLALAEAYPVACAARGAIDQTRGKEGFTSGICGTKLIASLAGAAGSSAETDATPAAPGDDD